VPLLFVLTKAISLGQYIYGVYLGFNGEILPEVRSIPDPCLLIHEKPYLFLSAPSCCSPRCCPCLRATSSRCSVSTSQNTFWRRILVHSSSLQQVDRTRHEQKFDLVGPPFLSLKCAAVSGNRQLSCPLHLAHFPSFPFHLLWKNNRGNRSNAPNPGPCPLPEPILKRLSARFKNEA
jgi:hypothetical protein